MMSQRLDLTQGADFLDPNMQQKLEGVKGLIRREIQKELKIKEGTENLRKVMTNKKNLAHVENILKSSNQKLERLHWELQELNAQIVVMDRDNLRGECKSWTSFSGISLFKIVIHLKKIVVFSFISSSVGWIHFVIYALLLILSLADLVVPCACHSL